MSKNAGKTTESPWISLEETFTRTYKTIPTGYLNKILVRGRVPLVATRSDMVDHPRDRIESLLANAGRSYFDFISNRIRASYIEISPDGLCRFDLAVEVRASLFGQHSSLAKPYHLLSCDIDFGEVRVH
jgi:hypothetical protein